MTITIDDADVVTLKAMAQKYGLCTPIPGGSRPNLLYGYFGGGSAIISEFADHCNFLHVGSWGDWVTPQGRLDLTNKCITEAQTAVALGITKIMFTFDWCLFTPQMQLLPTVQRQQLIDIYVNALMSAGVSQYTHAIYTLDEPDVNHVSAQAVSDANSTLRDVFSWYPHFKGKPLVTTYGVQGTPGIASFDWAGFDNYGTPIFTNGEFNAFVAKLTANQKITLIPGGGSPWKDNPTPFNAKAQSDLRIALVLPFIWQDGTTQGIRSNGMAPQYKAKVNSIKRIAAQCQCPGYIAEVGVYKGGVLLELAELFPARVILGYDTFKGLPAEQWSEGELHKPGDFDETSLGEVRRTCAGAKNIVLVPGLFPDTGINGLYAFVHLDVDFYLATKYALAWLSPRMSNGSAIVLDDWDWHMCPGIRRAVEALGLTATLVPNTAHQAVIYF